MTWTCGAFTWVRGFRWVKAVSENLWLIWALSKAVAPCGSRPNHDELSQGAPGVVATT